MKVGTKKLCFSFAVMVFLLVGSIGAWLSYLDKYVHQHCIKAVGMAFKLYSSEHQGQFPFDTNSFGNALLLLAKDDPSIMNSLCGPDDDGHFFKMALQNNSIIPEDQCSRVYIQGLGEKNDPEICILFDRNSCRGGDHSRSPWGHFLREVCLLDGSMQIIRDEDWPKFSQKQVELLVAAGFSRTNALHFYPAAN